MSHQKIEIAADGGKAYLSGVYSLPSQLTQYAGAQTLILMVHGFPGNRESHDNLFGDFESLFNQYGLHTLRFDFRGCGHSEGKPEDFTIESALHDLGLVLSWAEHQAFDNIILIGEGLGAYLCLRAITPHVKAMMLFWPVSDLALYAAGAAGPSLPAKLKAEIAAMDDVPFDDLNIPVMVQYGAQDKTIVSDHADLLKDRLKARRIDLTSYADGAEGLLDPRHRKMIYFHIGQFIEKYA